MSEYNYFTFSDLNFERPVIASDIDSDIRRKLNAKLEGNQAKTFLRRIPDQQRHQILRIIQESWSYPMIIFFIHLDLKIM